METSTRLNTFIREFTRRAIKIPEFKPIEGCEWPNPDKACDSVRKKILIESAGQQTLRNPARYSLKSLDEIRVNAASREKKYCSIGPEFQKLLKDPGEVENLARAFTTWTERSKTMTPEEKSKFLVMVTELIRNDINRRGITIGLYVLYFTLALVLLVQQYGLRENLADPPLLQSPLLLLVLFLIPLLSSFYIHVRYADRVRNTTLLHLIPISILITYLAYSAMVARSSVENLPKYTMIASQIITLIGGIAAVTLFRGYYDECHSLQTGLETGSNSGWVLLVGLGGILLPTLLTLVSTTGL